MTSTPLSPPPPLEIERAVASAIAEDVGPGDLTARVLPLAGTARARVITREPGVLCGQPWFAEVFHQIDPDVRITWEARDGDRVTAGQVLSRLEGSARSLLTGERTALNFLQLLCGTATQARHYADAVTGTGAVVLDTRKTVPGLRLAQKYAVACGGCRNHRFGLYDGILIKENHIAASGSVRAAVEAAKRGAAAGALVEIEVEGLDQLREALAAGADRLLLDNFDLASLRAAVQETGGRARLEASGGITLANIREIAQTGVDFISIGDMTKNVRALDLSLRFVTD